MEKLKKYSSIENSYQDEFIQKIIERGFDEGEFVVQEKVHGANLSFWCDGSTIKCAKRTEFIAPDDTFYAYSHEALLKKYRSSILGVFKDIRRERPNISSIAIFGELFGGGYPHQAVERDRSAVAIQKGIYYCPNNEFYGFDILVDGEDYLSVDKVNELFEKFNFFYAQTLFQGSFKEALQYPNLFESKVPSLLGLPLLEHNFCEGVVIKPVVFRAFPQSSRIIIKNKNDKWRENKKHNKLVLEQDKISDIANTLSEEITNYVTENRFNNVVSKIGEVSTSDFGKIISLYNLDVMEDFLKDYKSEFSVLEKKEQKLIKKSLNNAASKLIRDSLS